MRIFPNQRHEYSVGKQIRKHSRCLLCWALAAWIALAVTPAGATVIIQLRVLEGDGTVYPTGSRATRGLTVEVTDENGKPVDGATVSFRLPDGGPGGTFGSGLRSQVVTTHAEGKATVWGMQWNKSPGPFEIQITAVKELARAGIVSKQYLNDLALPKPGGSGTFTASHHGRAKWYVISAVAAGALAGAAFSRSSQAHTAAAAPAPGLQIGTPSIIIGHP